jgi:hypothetical protein
MPREGVKNLAASVRQRLLNIAKDRGEPFDLLLTQYGLERILYRVSVSEWADEFILKGALLFTLWDRVPRPPTRDADLLGRGPAELERLGEIFRALCTLEVADDGLTLNPGSVRVEEIREGNAYQGIRVRISGALDSAIVPIQIDVGFGDVVIPESEEVEFPTLLDFTPPRLRAYTAYTVIAEKLQAIVALGIANSRMKDYYDLWALSGNMDFQLATLGDAIRATFDRRKTEIPAKLPVGLTAEFSNDETKLRQWAAFVSKNYLDEPRLDLDTVVENLGTFLALPIQTALSDSMPDSEKEFWTAGGPWKKQPEEKRSKLI